MRTVTIEKKLYTFDELSKASQDRVINNIVQNMIEYEYDSPDVAQALLKAENMATPWFSGEYVLESCRDRIYFEARNSEYEFNGSWFCLMGD